MENVVELPPSTHNLSTSFFSCIKNCQLPVRKRVMPYELIKLPSLLREPEDIVYQFSPPRLYPSQLFFLCGDCIIPQLIVFCNGRVAIEDSACLFAQKEAQSHDSLDEDRYDFFRSVIGLRNIMIRTTMDKLGKDSNDDFRKRFCDEQGNILDEKLFETLSCKRVHVNGCLYSDRPKVVISGLSHKDVDGSEGSPQLRRGDIGSNLFFKHCDGVLCNAKGETMETGREDIVSLGSAMEDLQL